MKQARATLTLLAILLLLGIFLFRRWQEPKGQEIFDRSPDALIYTKHARCRMECRHISEKDIGEIMDKGIINMSKTDLRDRPCPSFALQGETSSGQSLRVIFAQCDDETRVVTCYNLKQDFECHCPGDEKKKR